MLASTKAVLDLTDVEKITVGAFNITSLRGIQAILGAVEELGQSVIPQFAPAYEPAIPLKVIGSVMVMTIEKSPVSVRVYLDHGDKLEILQEALEMGFTSVVYNDPVLPFEENAANTKTAVEVVRSRGASIETEIGVVGRREFSSAGEGEEGEAVESCYTDPEQVRAFTALTGIDALACLFGTVHGPYLTTPKLDFGRIHRIRENIGIPIVMHGGSGVSDGGFKKCVASGVREINYYTCSAEADGIYVKEKCVDAGEYVSLHDVTQWAAQAMKEDVLRTIKVFSHLE